MLGRTDAEYCSWLSWLSCVVRGRQCRGGSPRKPTNPACVHDARSSRGGNRGRRARLLLIFVVACASVVAGGFVVVPQARRTVSVMSGCRFICGVGFADLADYDEKFCANNNPDAGPSFVRVCERLVQLDASALFDLSGWVVVLKPGQALQIPPGHLTAETNMTETSAMAGWSSMPLRYPHVDMVLDWDRHLTSALHLLQCDISSGRFDNNRHLNSCQKHLSLGKTQLLPWVSKMGMTVEPSVTPENDKPTMQQQQRLLVVKQEEGADTSRDMGERTSAAENASDDEEVIFVSESLAQECLEFSGVSQCQC